MSFRTPKNIKKKKGDPEIFFRLPETHNPPALLIFPIVFKRHHSSFFFLSKDKSTLKNLLDVELAGKKKEIFFIISFFKKKNKRLTIMGNVGDKRSGSSDLASTEQRQKNIRPNRRPPPGM
jgi:hypothetical protein